MGKDEMFNQQKVNGGVTVFFEKNRKPLLFCIAGIAVLCIGFVVSMIVSDEINKQTIAKLEPYIERFENILKGAEYTALIEKASSDSLDNEASGAIPVTEDNAGIADDSAETAATEPAVETIDDFLTDITIFAENHSGYPAAKAWSVIAHLYAKKGSWKDAEDAYLKTAEKGKKTHLIPISYFNAAVCSEEQGELSRARKHYTAAARFHDFSQGARAWFSIGRLYEEEHDIKSALEAYQTVIDDWGKDEDWSSLAHSRIIALNIEGNSFE